MNLQRVYNDDAGTLADVTVTGPRTGRAVIDGQLASLGLLEGRWVVYGWLRPIGEQDLRGTALEGVVTR